VFRGGIGAAMRGRMTAEIGVPFGVLLDRQFLPEETLKRLIERAPRKTLVGREPVLGQNPDQLRIKTGIVKLAGREEFGMAEARYDGVLQSLLLADEIAVLIDLDFQRGVDLVLRPLHAALHVKQLP